MPYVELIALLAVMQFIFFGMMTGRARGQSGLQAPAVVGNEHFERMYRVQMNTLETLVAFLPALLIAGKYWSPLFVSVLGVIYLLGRLIYWRAYLANPAKRGLGFIISILPTWLLVLLALLGTVRALF